MKLVKIIDQKVIISAIKNIASKIPQDDEVVFLGILEGCSNFLSFLTTNHIKVPIKYVKACSYKGRRRGDLDFHFQFDLEEIRGKKVYIVDDIIDSGFTLNKISKQIEPYAKEIKWCCLFKKDHSPNHCNLMEGSIIIPEEFFIVGFGMDFDGEYRNLDDLYTIDPIK